MKRFGVRAALVAAVAFATAEGLRLQPHNPWVPSLLAGVLVPLMGATLRRVFVGDRLRGLVDESPRRGEKSCCAERQAGGYACICSPSRDALARNNARLRHELINLETAYAELAAKSAERNAALDRLSHLAHHDPLTSLPNRLLLMDRLTQAIASAQRAGTGVLVVYLDLDHFKAINDTMGHAAGDAVLCEMSRRFTGCLRTTDTACRIGGDEFVLVCTTTDAAEDAALIRSRLTRAIAGPMTVNGTPLALSASMGMSAYPADGSDATLLIDAADRAMYLAKVRERPNAERPADGRVEIPAQKRRAADTRRYTDDGPRAYERRS